MCNWLGYPWYLLQSFFPALQLPTSLTTLAYVIDKLPSNEDAPHCAPQVLNISAAHFDSCCLGSSGPARLVFTLGFLAGATCLVQLSLLIYHQAANCLEVRCELYLLILTFPFLFSLHPIQNVILLPLTISIKMAILSTYCAWSWAFPPRLVRSRCLQLS